MEEFNGKLNVVSLKEYVEHVTAALEKNFDNRLALMDKAVTKAETAMEKRFDSVNEFRGALQDLTRSFVPRPEMEEMIANTNDKLSAYCAKLDKIENMKQGGNVAWAYVLSGVSLLAALLALMTNIT